MIEGVFTPTQRGGRSKPHVSTDANPGEGSWRL